MEFWDSESTWTGYGQTVSVLVHENPNNGGGGGGAIPGLPQHDFSISSYLNGDSLIAWKGTDGSPYQLYTTDSYFGVNDPPLFGTEVVDPNGDYKLFLFQSGAPLPPNAASLTLAALPQVEQDKITFLTSAQQQIVNELAANGGTTTQTGAISSNVGNKGFFRLIIGREDTDGDGLYNDIEETFGTNPFEDDTDQDGVTDPWDHANIGHVIISEFMAANEGTIADEDGDDNEDYIELFNPTSSTVNLSNHFLACSINDLNRWQIPNGVTLAPGQSLLVFASGKNRTNPANNLHTDFGLRATGEDVFFVAPNGSTIIDSHTGWGRQRLNASAAWGLDQETGLISALRYFLEPTPGFLNDSNSCTGLSDTPLFNRNGGIFSNTVETVTISAVDVGDVIHYTLDGSNPTEESPIYDGTPIQVDSTTIVRAMAIKPGCVASPIAARSFLFKEDVIGTGGQGNPAVGYQVRPTNYPVFARLGDIVQGDLDYAMDPLVIENQYDAIASDLEEIPTLSVSLPVDEFFGPSGGIYAQSPITDQGDDRDPFGNGWNRLASFEYIDPSNPTQYVQESGEITISGGSSRDHTTSDKHNMRIIFKSKFSVGGNSDLEFASAPFAGSVLRNFKQLLLRNPTHDSWLIKWTAAERARSTNVKETWMRSLHETMQTATLGAENPGNWVAHRKWINLYINGLYWGGGMK